MSQQDVEFIDLFVDKNQDNIILKLEYKEVKVFVQLHWLINWFDIIVISPITLESCSVESEKIAIDKAIRKFKYYVEKVYY